MNKEFLQDFLTFRGVKELNPPQAECVPHLFQSKKNLVVALPTGSGKTMIAEIAIVDTIRNIAKKAIYLSPLVALAKEKHDDFETFQKPYNFKAAIRTSEYDSDERDLSGYHLVSSTYEKFDSISRRSPEWLQDVGLIVVDEAHMVCDRERGPTLECLLTRMRARYPATRIILLSAVMPNVSDFAKWLDAETIQSDWRAVPLKKGLFVWNKSVVHRCGSRAKSTTKKCNSECLRLVKGKIEFLDGSQRWVSSNTDQPIAALALDILQEGAQSLVFARGRAETVKQAKLIGAVLAGSFLTPEQKNRLGALATAAEKELREKFQFDAEAYTLLECIRNGTAFHHAGMDKSLRAIVEEGFKTFALKVIIATPTLAAGVNLPARRVVIQSTRRWSADRGWEEIERWNAENMLGRAGRRAFDPYGEGVILGQKEVEGGEDEEDENEKLMAYLRQPVENIESKLFSINGLTSHVLAEVCAQKEDGVDFPYLERFFKSTFGAKSGQVSEEGVDDVLHASFNFLKENSLVFATKSDTPRYFATRLGQRLNQTYIDPLSLTNIEQGLGEALRRTRTGQWVRPFGILHVVCSTHDWSLRRAVDEIGLNYAEYEFLLDRKAQFYNSAIAGACILRDQIEEVPDPTIAAIYKIGKGDIAVAKQSAMWILSSMKALAPLMGFGELNPLLDETLRRVTKGVKKELLSLASLKGIARKRARELFNAGIKTREELLTPRGLREGSRILGEGTLRQVLKESGITEEDVLLEHVEVIGPNRSLDAFRGGSAGN